MMQIWVAIIYIVVALLAGGALCFFLSQRYFKKYLRENPPVN